MVRVSGTFATAMVWLPGQNIASSAIQGDSTERSSARRTPAPAPTAALVLLVSMA